MKVDEFITNLRNNNSIVISVSNNELKINGSQKSLNNEIIEEIKSRKSEILDFFKSLSLDKNFSAIEPAGKMDHYHLSSAQQRLYFLHEFQRTSLAYNIPQVLRMSGDLDTIKLTAVFKKLIVRHESLRTCFCLIDEEPVQKVVDQFDFDIEYFKSNEGDEASIVQQFSRPFDLAKTPLIRVGLIDVGPKEYILMVDMPHIISDGISQNILISDFVALYRGEELPGLELQYKDYAEWQQSEKQQQEILKQRDFWLNEYVEEVSVLQLPADFSRPPVKSHNGSTLRFEISRDDTKALRLIAESGEASLFMVLLAIYNIFLSKLGSQEDLVIGVPTAGRQHADLEGIIGMFVNTLPIRNRPEGNLSFKGFLSAVKEKTLKCFENQSYQYEQLVEQLKVGRDTSHNPLFDFMFSYESLGKSALDIPNLTINISEADSKVSKFDLSLLVMEGPDKLFLNFEYSTDLYSETTLKRFVNYFKTIVKEILSDVDKKLKNIKLITEEERYQLITTLNNTWSPYPKDETIISLFLKQAEKTPENIAIRFGSECLTYREVSNLSSKIASYLKEQKNVKNGDLIGVMLERELYLIPFIYGILQAGAAYIPIDPHYPAERIKSIMADSGSQLLVTRTVFEESFVNPSVEFLNLDRDLSEIERQEITRAGEVLNLESLAYVIYTSGTTGKPKGVMVQHDSVVNILKNLQEKYPVNRDDSFIFKTTFCFDVSIVEIFGWFHEGASVAILEPGSEADPHKIISAIKRHAVTHINFVPSVFSVFLNTITDQKLRDIKSLKYIFLAGEAISIGIVNKFNSLNSGISLENLYGPTEATVYCSSFSLKDLNNRKTVPIGKPLKNVKFFIVDDDGELQPLGVRGELCIGGAGLAQGYIQNVRLNEEKFVHLPFLRDERVYKTGDLTRWLPDGNIEYLGRKDNQIKLRGFRIELSEIEHHLSSFEGIKEAIVIMTEYQEENCLAAYYVAKLEFEPGQLRNYLSKTLPEYMLPSYFIWVQQIPLTANGKLDKKALSKPGSIAIRHAFEGPGSETEKKLTEIWSEILKVDKELISVNTSFFDIGGHSLRATVLMYKILKYFNVEIPLKTIFQSQNIRSISIYIDNQKKSAYFSVAKSGQKLYYSLSSAQKRLYFLYELDKSSLAYNIPYVIQLNGDVNREKLKDVFKMLILRHESLRTSFEVVNDEPVQKIGEQADFDMEYFHSDQKEIDGIIQKFIRPFNLNNGPLLRIGLIQTSIDEYFLMIDMHHIITDGISQGILIRDFISMYNEKELPAMELQYKDYAEWEQSSDQQEKIAKQRDFWTGEFANAPAILELPSDFQRNAIESHNGDAIPFEITKEEFNKLKYIAEKEEVTMFMLVFSIYNIFLSKICNQEEVVIGTPVAGRQHVDMENIIGIFINILPVRNIVDKNLTFREFLSAIKSKTLASFENQNYPYERLIEHLNIERNGQRNPLFNTEFSYKNFEHMEVFIDGLKTKPYKNDFFAAKFDITLSAMEENEKLLLNLQYSSDLFHRNTIKKFISYFKKIVSTITINLDQKLSEIEILSAADQEQILYNFNNTHVDYAKDKTIIDLFEKQVRLSPNNVAIYADGKELTYSQLNAEANKLGHYLRNKYAVEANDLIGVMLDRSHHLIIGILGILKAGGAYVPIDPSYPESRIRLMIENSGLKSVLTGGELEQEHNLVDIISLSKEAKIISLQPDSNLLKVVGAESLVYVIYTSGSTGIPKGVMVKHHSFTNLINWYSKVLDLTESDALLLVAPISFDLAQKNIFISLIHGASLCLSERFHLNYGAIADVIFERKITVINLAPSAFYPLLENDVNDGYSKLESLKKVILGGEPINMKKILNWSKSDFFNAEIINSYGPTECTDVVSYYRITDEELQVAEHNIPIGKPINNTQLYVLDADLKCVPIGISGEIYIGGEGVSKGYLNNDILTSSKFIKNPYEEGSIYKTGDLGKWLPDGNIHFMGRKDDQIKIRGFRVELGEIESQLNVHGQVDESVVVARTQDGSVYLAAYYVSNKEIDFSVLRGFLSQKLPDYMVPSFFVHLKKLPLTPSGKIDKKSLPDPDIKTEHHVTVLNETEEKLIEIWAEVLKVDKEAIGIDRSFFELGGHSLKAITLISKIEKEFNTKIQLESFFLSPTIRELEKNVLISDLSNNTNYSSTKITI